MIPSLSLEVAWPYLSEYQKSDFQMQARSVPRQLHIVTSADAAHVPDPDMSSSGHLHPSEMYIIFSPSTRRDREMGFMHNDLTPSRCIVEKDRIVGIIG